MKPILFANSSGQFVLIAHLSEVLIHLLEDKILCLQNSLVDGVKEFQEHENVAGSIEQWVAVIVGWVKVGKEERVLCLLGCCLFFGRLKIHGIELLRSFGIRAGRNRLADLDLFQFVSTGLLLGIFYFCHVEFGWRALGFAWLILDCRCWWHFPSLHILNFNLDLLSLFLLLEPIQVIQVVVLIHDQINLPEAKALHFAMSAHLVEPLKLRYIHEVFQDLPHVLCKAWSIVIMVHCRVSDVET